MGELSDEDFDDPRQHDELWQSIVDGLRRAGWCRWDAYQEADDRIARIEEAQTDD